MRQPPPPLHTQTALEAIAAVVAARKRLVLDVNQEAKTVFFATLAMRLDIIPDPSVQTWATNGRQIKINPDWTLDRSPPEHIASLCHEILHCVLGHPARMGNRDPRLWNIACDLAINPICRDLGLTLPAGVLIPGEGRYSHLDPGHSAEHYYRRLTEPEDEQDEPGAGQQDDQQDDQPDEDQQTDDEDDGDAGDDQKNADEDQNTRPDDDDGNGDTDDQQTDDDQPGQPADDAADADGQPDGFGDDPGNFGGVIPPDDPADAEATRAEWQVATAQAEMLGRARGDLPGGLAEVVGEVVRPTTPWADVLRDFITQTTREDDYSWHHPDRRFIADDLYMPDLYSERVGKILLIVDRSGSCNQLLDLFAGHIEAIVDASPTELVIYYHDMRTAGIQTWEPTDGPLELEPVGGGGTSHTEVIPRAAEDHPDADCMICLTDLDTRFPDAPPPMPVLWAGAKNPWQQKLPQPPWGELLEINED